MLVVGISRLPQVMIRADDCSHKLWSNTRDFVKIRMNLQ